MEERMCMRVRLGEQRRDKVREQEGHPVLLQYDASTVLVRTI